MVWVDKRTGNVLGEMKAVMVESWERSGRVSYEWEWWSGRRIKWRHSPINGERWERVKRIS